MKRIAQRMLNRMLPVHDINRERCTAYAPLATSPSGVYWWFDSSIYPLIHLHFKAMRCVVLIVLFVRFHTIRTDALCIRSQRPAAQLCRKKFQWMFFFFFLALLCVYCSHMLMRFTDVIIEVIWFYLFFLSRVRWLQQILFYLIQEQLVDFVAARGKWILSPAFQ